MFRKIRKYNPPWGWVAFSRQVRSKDRKFLKRLSDFIDPILVTGCQRSGTTLVRRAVGQSSEILEFWKTKDDELDAARLLTGMDSLIPKGRYCFQTTYVNERYHEYFEHEQCFKMIWVIREPNAVVRSMLYNWKMFPLNELFTGCGVELLNEQDRVKFNRFGNIAFSSLKRAVYSYKGKMSQLPILYKHLGKENIFVVDYDVLLNKPNELKRVYEFCGLNFKQSYSDIINPRQKPPSHSMKKDEIKYVRNMCENTYREALSYI